MNRCAQNIDKTLKFHGLMMRREWKGNKNLSMRRIHIKFWLYWEMCQFYIMLYGLLLCERKTSCISINSEHYLESLNEWRIFLPVSYIFYMIFLVFTTYTHLSRLFEFVSHMVSVFNRLFTFIQWNEFNLCVLCIAVLLDSYFELKKHWQ